MFSFPTEKYVLEIVCLASTALTENCCNRTSVLFIRCIKDISYIHIKNLYWFVWVSRSLPQKNYFSFPYNVSKTPLLRQEITERLEKVCSLQSSRTSKNRLLYQMTAKKCENFGIQSVNIISKVLLFVVHYRSTVTSRYIDAKVQAEARASNVKKEDAKSSKSYYYRHDAIPNCVVCSKTLERKLHMDLVVSTYYKKLYFLCNNIVFRN